MKTLIEIKEKFLTKEVNMKTAFNKNIIKLLCLKALLVLNVACVITPDPSYPVSAGVDVNLTPQIVFSDSSFVTVRLGPSFYASDAYLLAYDYCLNRGMYAYEVSTWAHSAVVVRDLRYACRPTYIAPPIVYSINPNNRYRYNYFQGYYRTHRPNYHYRTEPSTGWWGQNKNNNNNHPHHGTYEPGYSRDGRATTPQSPWSYNNNKNRYQPRETYKNNINSSPVKNSSPGWWGSSPKKKDRYSSVEETPKKNSGSFWGKNNKSDNKNNGNGYKYGHDNDNGNKYGHDKEKNSKKYESSAESKKSNSFFSSKNKSNSNAVPSKSDSGDRSSAGKKSNPGWWGK